MSEMHIFYNTIAGDEGSLRMLVMPDAAQLRTDWSEPPRSTIGQFRMLIEAEQQAELLRRVRGIEADSAAAPPDMLPGTRLINIGLTEDGKRSRIESAEYGAVPDRLQPVVDSLDALVEKVLDHPKKAVGADAVWGTPAVAAGADIALDFTLRNAGSEPVVIANPAAGETAGAVGVMLTLIWTGDRKDTGNVNFLPADPGEIVQLDEKDRPMPAASQVLALEPGDEARFRLRRTLRLVPGEYRTRLAITCHDVQEDTVPRIDGTIVAMPGELTITR